MITKNKIYNNSEKEDGLLFSSNKSNHDHVLTLVRISSANVLSAQHRVHNVDFFRGLVERLG